MTTEQTIMKLELHFTEKDVDKLVGATHSGFVSKQPNRFESDTTDCSNGQHGLADPTIAKLAKQEGELGRDCSMMWLTNEDNYLHAMIVLAWHKKIYGEACLLWDMDMGGYVIWSPFNWEVQYEQEETP
tara:strand:+ start:547 stop:933 length:387 start_codon:yes stop_codon:yes gene_type:complete